VKRRRYLTTIITVSTLVFAGCSQGGDTNAETNSTGDGTSADENTSDDGTDTSGSIPDAASLLPQPEDYTLDERNQQAAGMIGGDNGMQGVYSDGSGTEFSVEIIVFADEDAETAENNTSTYTAGENWNLVVLHDNVIYAVSEISEEEAKDVLATSPRLDRSTIEANIVS